MATVTVKGLDDGGLDDGGLSDGSLSDGGLSDGGRSDGGLSDIVCPTATKCLGAGPASFHAPTPTTTYFVGAVVTLGVWTDRR